MDSMHVGGMGSEATLSVLLLVVGLGCLVGPLLCMAVVPGTMCYMTAGLAVCFLMFAASTCGGGCWGCCGKNCIVLRWE